MIYVSHDMPRQQPVQPPRSADYQKLRKRLLEMIVRNEALRKAKPR